MEKIAASAAPRSAGLREASGAGRTDQDRDNRDFGSQGKTRPEKGDRFGIANIT